MTLLPKASLALSAKVPYYLFPEIFVSWCLSGYIFLMPKNQKDFYPGDIPQQPGAYIFRDRMGEVIYVGKATNLRKRLSQYFQKSRMRQAEPKLRSLINSITDWECMPVRNEAEALILEARLINDYAPRYNVLLRDDKRFLLIKINPQDLYPRLQLARLQKDDVAQYFGPFPQSSVLRETVDFLTRHFGLRSCKVAIPGERDHRHCLASIVKDCCEPCVGKVSREDYLERVGRLMQALKGDIAKIIYELRQRMELCSEKQKFEKAASWRDLIQHLETICGNRNRSFRFTALPVVTDEDSVADLKQALKMPVLPVRIEAFDVSNIGGKLAVASMVCFINGKPDKRYYRRFRIQTVKQADDYAMLQEAIKRHYGRRLRENGVIPELIIVDGGKGQLQAAIKAMIKIKMPAAAVIGLAKKQEEIFLPGKSNSLILDRHQPALRLVQAIRDEAHRFALAYHRKLREKRLQESLLDDISGIGPNRKRALLQAFGSIRKLRQATPEEIIAKVPKIGEKFADIICRHLHSSPEEESS